MPPTSSVPPSAPLLSPDTSAGGLLLDAAPPPLPRGSPMTPRGHTTVVSAREASPSECRTFEVVAVVAGSGPPPVVPRLSVHDHVGPLIEFLGVTRTPTAIAALDVKLVSSAILARTCASEVPVRISKGLFSVFGSPRHC